MLQPTMGEKLLVLQLTLIYNQSSEDVECNPSALAGLAGLVLTTPTSIWLVLFFSFFEFLSLGCIWSGASQPVSSAGCIARSANRTELLFIDAMEQAEAAQNFLGIVRVVEARVIYCQSALSLAFSIFSARLSRRSS